MKRLVGTAVLLLACTCAWSLPVAAQPAFVDRIDGAWTNPATTGQGLFLDFLPGANVLFVGWYTFAPDGDPPQPHWLTAQLRFNGPVASGPLIATEGGQFDTPPGPGLRTAPSGTMVIDFARCDAANVRYSWVREGGTLTGSFDAIPTAALVGAEVPACAAPTKRRLPHAPPELDDAAYADLVRQLFVINNFGQHQGRTDQPGTIYLHDGIDIVLPNGTPIHSIESGVVRSVEVDGQGASTVIVQTDEDPTAAWAYVHVASTLAPGQRLAAGDRIGTVRFTGVEHLHLSRMVQPAGSASWRFFDLLTVDPAGHFDYVDSEPPVFQPELIFLPQGSDERFGDDEPLSGAVDIVAGIRDAGEYARASGFGPGVGDRLAVAWVEYEIAGEGVFFHQRAFDFHTLMLDRPPDSAGQTAQARVVYQPYLLIEPVFTPDRTFSYYVLTNGTAQQQLDVSDRARAWQTDAVDAEGVRVWPDGEYRITVRAGDTAGNIAEMTDTVEVRND
jgi:hypothetical protein